MTEDEEHDIDLIEGYHKGTLTADELRSLKDRMAADPSFAQKVEDYRDIFVGIKAHGEKKFSEMVGHWEKEIAEQDRVRPLLTRARVLNVAASILLVIGVAAFFYWLHPGPTSQELYAEYFVPYENIMDVRGESDQLLQEASGSYSRQAFPEAAKQFKKYLESNPDDLIALFYYGVSEIGAGNESPGISALNTLVENNDLLKDQAEWYIALGLLRSKKVEECKIVLRSIDRDNHDYQQKARALLEELD